MEGSVGVAVSTGYEAEEIRTEWASVTAECPGETHQMTSEKLIRNRTIREVDQK
ncbi:MAG: hypothetical protein DIKNOCCD_00620 [bacterium]|nr:hypothetical protein [bacterium]